MHDRGVEGGFPGSRKYCTTARIEQRAIFEITDYRFHCLCGLATCLKDVVTDPYRLFQCREIVSLPFRRKSAGNDPSPCTPVYYQSKWLLPHAVNVCTYCQKEEP